MTTKIENEMLVKNYELSVPLPEPGTEIEYLLRHIEDSIGNTVEILLTFESGDNDFLSIQYRYLKKFRRNKYNCIRISVGFIDRYETIVNRKRSQIMTMGSIAQFQGWGRFINQSKLYCPDSSLVFNNCLRLFCRLEEGDNMMSLSDVNDSNGTLNNRAFKKLLEEQQFTDFTIVVKNKEFPVHKFILAARSPVLKAMITTDMIEKRESKVVLQEIDEDVAEQFIYFLYTGTVPKIHEMARKLVAVADYFDVPELKILCVQTVYRRLDENNVLDALVFGSDNNLHELILRSIEFIAKNRDKVISHVNEKYQNIE